MKKRRALVWILTCILTFSMCGNYVLAEEAETVIQKDETGESKPEENEEKTETDGEKEEAETDEAGDEAEIPDDADEEKTETDGAETAAGKEVASWVWNDSDDILQWSEENNRWEVSFAGVSEENPLTKEALNEMLPQSVTATIDGEEQKLPVSWDTGAYPDSSFKGEYEITASLGEGYVLAADAGAMTAVILLDGEAVDYAVDDARYQVDGVSPKGTTINLFDYWLEARHPEGGDYAAGEQAEEGINSGHQLKFGLGWTNENKINKWTGYTYESTTGCNQVLKGMLEDTLADGYPQLKASTDLGITSDESLKYLFDEADRDGKKVYQDVENLLQIDDGDGYFYYDSTKNFASFDEDNNRFKLYNTYAVNKGNSTLSRNGQFFPFNKGTDVFEEERRELNQKAINPTDSVLNHYFGLTMSTRFIQQYGGYTDANRTQEVTYEFSGDDDVWVFIDDVLVADLGGMHDAASLEINFRTGAISINGSADGTLRSKFRNAGVDGEYSFSRNTFADGTYHTLKFYYLERGNSDSNMSLKFNMVTVPESDIIKVDQLGNPVAGAEFALYATDADYHVGNTDDPIATGVTDGDGGFVLEDGEGKLISLNDLYNRGDMYFVLKETKVPEGYRSSGEIPLYLYHAENSDAVVMLSAKYWENGTYASAKTTTTLPTNVYDVNNRKVDVTEGTVFAVVLKYSGNGESELEDSSKWNPVSGSVTGGWNVSSGSDMDAITEAARANPYTFSLASDGSYKTEITNMPGDIKSYYYMLGADKSGTKYTIGYYYTSGTLNNATARNTVRLDCDNAFGNNHQEFERVFATDLYVPNIKNYLLVQKLNEDGTALGNAEFKLYREEDVRVAADGSVTIEENAEAYDSLTTGKITTPLKMEGGGLFPNKKQTLPAGDYYLVETNAPDGYQVNENITHVVIDESGVYADAGEKDDGIVVQRGVGSIVKSMVQFASDDGIDRTLHNIVATLYVRNSETGEWNNSGESTHLKYSADTATLEYAPHTGDDELTLGVDEGWSELVIQQCGEGHDEDASAGAADTGLGDTDITKLFSGSVTVQVTDEKEAVLEDFSFTKINQQENALSGAHFGLYELVCGTEEHEHDEKLLEVDENGQIAADSVNADCWKLVALTESSSVGIIGEVKFEDLDTAAKEFRLVEYEAPGGYILPEGQWIVTYDEAENKFTIQENGSVGNPPAYNGADSTIINHKPGELPFTGNTGIKIFLIIGAVLMISGAIGGTWYMKIKSRSR